MPKIIQLIEPEDGLDAAVLMECVPGDLLKSETITKTLASKIGALLACIHLEHAEGYGDLTDPSYLRGDPRIPFTMKFEEGLGNAKIICPRAFLKHADSISIKTSTFFCPPTALALYTEISARATSSLLMKRCEASSTGLQEEEGLPKMISAPWSLANGLFQRLHIFSTEGHFKWSYCFPSNRWIITYVKITLSVYL